jgi:hypothetical protein
MSWYVEFDGIGFGNRAWAELERASDTEENRRLLGYHCEQAVLPLVNAGLVADVTVEVDDPVSLDGVAVRMTYTDLDAQKTRSLFVPAPWGI